MKNLVADASHGGPGENDAFFIPVTEQGALALILIETKILKTV